MSIIGAERKLNALIRNLSPNRMRQCTGVMMNRHVKSNKEQFNLKGIGQYAPLSPPYKEQKFKKYGKKPILVASGRLKKSVSDKQKQAESIRYHDHKGYEIGTSVPYAQYLHYGTDKMPKRPVIFYRESDKKRNHDTLKAHILEGAQ
jgi:phage gpG-like protein